MKIIEFGKLKDTEFNYECYDDGTTRIYGKCKILDILYVAVIHTSTFTRWQSGMYLRDADPNSHPDAITFLTQGFSPEGLNKVFGL